MPKGPIIGPRRTDERTYEAALRREILNPMLARTRLTIIEAQQTYYDIREDITALRADMRLLAAADVQARRAMEKTLAWHKQRFTTAMRRHFGVRVDLLSDTPIDLDARIRENVDLIRTIEPRFHAALSKRLTELAAQGPFNQSALMKVLAREYKSAGYNLRRLTRDQTSKLVGQLNHARQTELGIERYEWLTAGDERVRPTHANNNGEIFEWGNPPDTGPPGEEIQCRCVAVAVIPAAMPTDAPTDRQAEQAFHNLQRPDSDAAAIRYANRESQTAAQARGLVACPLPTRSAAPVPGADPRCHVQGTSLVFHGTDRPGWKPHAGTHFTPSLSAAARYSELSRVDDTYIKVLRVRNSELSRGKTLVPESLVDTDTAADIAEFLRRFPEAADSDLVTYADSVPGIPGAQITTYKPLSQARADAFEVVDTIENGWYIVDDSGRALRRLSYRETAETVQKQADEIAGQIGQQIGDDVSLVATPAEEWYEHGGKWFDDLAPEGTPVHMRAGVRSADINKVETPVGPVGGTPRVTLTSDGVSSDNPLGDWYSHLKVKHGDGDAKTIEAAKNAARWESDQGRSLSQRLRRASEQKPPAERPLNWRTGFSEENPFNQEIVSTSKNYGRFSEQAKAAKAKAQQWEDAQ